MSNLPLMSIETPINTGTDTSRQAATVQKSNADRKEPLAFKKKLEDCIKVDETPYGNSAAAANQSIDNTQDNSMAADLTDEQAQTQIVGILEGFGLLDYQSDLSSVSVQDGSATNTVNQILEQLLQGLTQTTEQAGALETYARMLSKDQLSQLPPELQQAIVKAVGDYLGSFESTNNAPVSNAADADTTPVITKAAGTAADISALPDQIAALLLKLKASQDAKTTAADTVKAPAEEAVMPANAQAGPETVKPTQAKPEVSGPAMVQPTDQPADDKANTVQTAKSSSQATASETQTAQKPDAAVTVPPVSVSAAQTDTTITTEKAQPNTGSDFVKDNVMRIVDKLSTQVSDGKTDFDVELKPDFLGKVSIKLSMQNGEIRMQIKTDDVNVKSMFADQVSSMQAALKDKGIAITNIDVTYQSQMQTSPDHRSFSQGGSSKKQSGRSQVSLDQIAGTGVFETMSQITGYMQGGSSVEYLA